MEKIYPRWLNKDFVKKALKSEGDSVLEVDSYNVTNATKPGENYLSDIYRVTASVTREYGPEVTSFIVKCSRDTEDIDLEARERSVFEREINTYTLILPSLHRLLSISSLENYQRLSANLLYIVNDPPQQAIVMQDLKAQGFKMADRTRGLELQHSLLVMKQIGRYHGASAVLQQKMPENFLYFHEGIYGSKVLEACEDFFRSGLTNLAQEVAKWPHYRERFSEKLLKLADNAYTKFLDSVIRREEEFNVLCHGDLWLNNMMFRYSQETGEVTDTRFVDYQFGYWTSPAADLHYFLYSSLSPELLDQHHTLVQEYYKSVTETLSALGYRGLQPTLAELQRQLHKRGPYAVVMCCALLPVFLLDRNNISEPNNILKKEAVFHLSEEYKDIMKKLLPIFEEKGWL